MHESPSSMSAQPTPSFSLDDQDEDVRIAVRALGAMRNSAGMSQSQSSAKTSFQLTPALSAGSATTSPPSTSLSSPSLSVQEDVDSPDFVSRVSHFPLVGTALRAYEQGKASSRVVKYGAEMMESSVKTISRPVIERLPMDVNQLDEFACRQLDRFGKYGRPSETEPGYTQTDERDRSWERGRQESAEYDSWSSGLQTRDASTSSSQRRNGKDKEVPVWYDADGTHLQQSSQPRSERDGADDSTGVEQNQQVAQRSRWQAVLMEAGGISAALSEESMRRLKYCLQWLQYATSHIDGQILVLRDFTTSLQSLPNNPSAIISPQHMRTLSDARRDVVQTVRQVVDVVSKYAGGALPEPARSRVRGFILHLPQRWASAAQGEGVAQGAGGGAAVGGVPVGSGTRRARGSRYQHHRERGTTSENGTPASSKPSSPLASPRLMPRRDIQANGHAPAGSRPPTAGAATQAAQRILTLSTESLDMMRGVTAVVKESLDRAEAWVERLRAVGVQRQQQQQHQQSEPHEPQPSNDPSGPPTPTASEGSREYDFSTVYAGSSSSRSAPPTPGGIDAPSPSVSHGLGKLTLGRGGDTVPGSTNSTPRNKLICLPEEEKAGPQQVKTEMHIREAEEGKVEVAGSGEVAESNPTTKPEPDVVKMEVDS